MGGGQPVPRVAEIETIKNHLVRPPWRNVRRRGRIEEENEASLFLQYDPFSEEAHQGQEPEAVAEAAAAKAKERSTQAIQRKQMIKPPWQQARLTKSTCRKGKQQFRTRREDQESGPIYPFDWQTALKWQFTTTVVELYKRITSLPKILTHTHEVRYL